jgi:hypothetical protein
MEGGIVPLRLFILKTRFFNLFSCPKFFGIPPRRLLAPPKIASTDDKFPKEIGISPTRLLISNTNHCIFDNDPSSPGSPPVSSLPPK